MNSQNKPVVLVNHRSPSASSGKATGISNYLINLTRSLIHRGNMEVGLVTSWQRQDFPLELSQGLSFFETRRMIWPRVVDTFWQSITMNGVANRFNADVIVNIDPIGSPIGGKLRLFIAHDLYFKTIPAEYSWKEKFCSDLIFRKMLRGNDAVVCVSDSTLRDLQSHYAESVGKSFRIHSGSPTLPNGSAVEQFEGRHVLWVSNVTANKNIDCFYNALELLAKRGAAVKSVVVGADPKGFEAKARSQLKHAAPPVRLENISRGLLSRLYETSSCVVNTSLSEGFGFPILEAQAHRAPVICPSNSAPAEIGGEGAVLTFQPNSPEDLADQITVMQKDQTLRKALVKKGLDNSKRFSWERTAAGLEDLIFKMLPDQGAEVTLNCIS